MRRYLAMMAMVNIVDTASTIWLANRIGWEYEGNPVVAWYFQRFGPWPSTILKVGGAVILAAILWHFCKEASVRWLPWLWLLVFAFVAAFNVGGVIAIGW